MVQLLTGAARAELCRLTDRHVRQRARASIRAAWFSHSHRCVQGVGERGISASNLRAKPAKGDSASSGFAAGVPA